MYKKGFTLIELLVVIAVIAILSGLVIVRIASAAQDARNSKRKADVNQIKQAVEKFKLAGGTICTCGLCGGGMAPQSADLMASGADGYITVGIFCTLTPVNQPHIHLASDDYPKDPSSTSSSPKYYWITSRIDEGYTVYAPETEPVDANPNNDIKADS